MFDLPYNFGDYTLVALVDRTRGGLLYQAIQQGMDRSVFLELLTPDNGEGMTMEEFLMNARTRAVLNIPVLGTVYEASQVQGYWFVTSEQLAGVSLQTMLEREETLSVRDMLKVIETVGGLCDRFERYQTAFAPIELRHVYLDDKSGVRLFNTAVPGLFHASMALEQLRALGAALAPLAPQGVSGATRIKTLLGWMAEGQNGSPMDWEQVMELIAAVKEQLGLAPHPTTHRYSVPVEPGRVASRRWMAWAGGAAFVIAAIAAGMMMTGLDGDEQPVAGPFAPPKPKPDFSARDHTEVPVRLPGMGALMVGAHEVTLESYNLFLTQWAGLTPDLRELYSHPDQPDKQAATHMPEDWAAMWKAANTPGGVWNGRKITRRSPVVNLTFWDACAYAAWKPVPKGEPRYRLPSREEWMALGALMQTGEKGDKTLVVDQYGNDYDVKTGVCGMASGVMEWTSSLERDPARVKEPPGPVACGGDWKNPGISSKLEYLRSRDERRDNLGFRIVRPAPSSTMTTNTQP